MKLDLCICETLSYAHGTMETTFVGMFCQRQSRRHLLAIKLAIQIQLKVIHGSIWKNQLSKILDSGETLRMHHQQAYLLPESFDIPWQAILRVMSDHFVILLFCLDTNCSHVHGWLSQNTKVTCS